jgi:hypothetical protein
MPTFIKQTETSYDFFLELYWDTPSLEVGHKVLSPVRDYRGITFSFNGHAVVVAIERTDHNTNMGRDLRRYYIQYYPAAGEYPEVSPNLLVRSESLTNNF